LNNSLGVKELWKESRCKRRSNLTQRDQVGMRGKQEDVSYQQGMVRALANWREHFKTSIRRGHRFYFYFSFL
jgi:hypothetical protein